MAEFKKSYGIALALFAFALSVTGVVLAATDPNPSAMAKDSLALNGVPPRSASLLVTVSNGQSYDLSATVNVNFDTSRAEAIVHFPLLFTQTSLDMRLIGHRVYAEAADISSGKWLEIHYNPPSFFGIALEVTQPGPDLNLIKGFDHERATKSGYYTTYDFSSNGVALTNALGSRRRTVLGSIDITVTTGSSGEVTGATMTTRSRHDMSTFTVQVLSYNQRAVISAPSTSDISALKVASFQELFASTSIATLLWPANFSSLIQGTAQVS
ncbi:MAG TPA: hypothetical protein VMU68_03030 [Acidimicrobiales bacterium]|nr:hypothetical protein [Acidimicrobiales bacterium]